MNQFPPLPNEFLKNMRKWLGKDYDIFLATYQSSSARKGLRANLLKTDLYYLQNKLDFLEDKIPWCKEGLYITPFAKAGNHPYHQAGLYYLQEPSAMSVVSALDPKPGEWILDLCAAPGGKTTQIASRMKGQGLLWANEPNSTRIKVLAENIERLGLTNCIISNETPERLAIKLTCTFDKILVDAPCSGEGMFRKDPALRLQWTWRGVEYCSERQKKILVSAVEMLKPGGLLVYSTCTFNPFENEGVIDWLLKQYKELELISHPNPLPCFDRGYPEWINSNNKEITKCVRLWPHRVEGEGHFLAILRKNHSKNNPKKVSRTQIYISSTILTNWIKFARDNLLFYPKQGSYIERNQHLFWLPEAPPEMNGLKILRPGLLLGRFKTNRFEPAHSAVMAWPVIKTLRQLHFDCNSPELDRYFHGDTFSSQGQKGWLAITVDGFPIGWGKDDGMIVKNHYPKGLR